MAALESDPGFLTPGTVHSPSLPTLCSTGITISVIYFRVLNSLLIFRMHNQLVRHDAGQTAQSSVMWHQCHVRAGPLEKQLLQAFLFYILLTDCGCFMNQHIDCKLGFSVLNVVCVHQRERCQKQTLALTDEIEHILDIWIGQHSFINRGLYWSFQD